MWKKKVVLGVIAVFIGASVIPCVPGDVTKNNGRNELHETLFFSEPLLKETENYVTIDITEANTYLTHPGTPALPVYTKTYTFPFGWAPHWYDAVLKSTGFGPWRPRDLAVPAAHRAIVDECMPRYEALRARRLRV